MEQIFKESKKRYKLGFTQLNNLLRKLKSKRFYLTGFTQLNNLLRKLKSKRFYLTGFTLIEMLVVIAIITILSSVLAVNYKNIQNQLALERAAFGLANDIRKVQNMAMENTYIAGCFEDDGVTPKYNNGPYKYKYGFGIEVDTDDRSKYVLYADCKSDYQYKQQDKDVNLYLPDFSAVEIDSVNSGTGRLDVVFMPPDPTIALQLNFNDEITASIKLRVKNDPTKNKTIIINKVGLVDIQ